MNRFAEPNGLGTGFALTMAELRIKKPYGTDPAEGASTTKVPVPTAMIVLPVRPRPAAPESVSVFTESNTKTV